MQTGKNTEQYKIIYLPKERWKNVCIPMRYTTEEYFDVEVKKVDNSFRVSGISKDRENDLWEQNRRNNESNN